MNSQQWSDVPRCRYTTRSAPTAPPSLYTAAATRPRGVLSATVSFFEYWHGRALGTSVRCRAKVVAANGTETQRRTMTNLLPASCNHQPDEQQDGRCRDCRPDRN